jgi:hypothetical protein
MATDSTHIDASETQFASLAQLITAKEPTDGPTGLLTPMLVRVSTMAHGGAAPISKASSPTELTTAYSLLDWWFDSHVERVLDDKVLRI